MVYKLEQSVKGLLVSFHMRGSLYHLKTSTRVQSPQNGPTLVWKSMGKPLVVRYLHSVVHLFGCVHWRNSIHQYLHGISWRARTQRRVHGEREREREGMLDKRRADSIYTKQLH